MQPTIYLDYAATAALRPPEVIEAVVRHLREIGGTPGRAGHARALEAGRIALRGRRLVAELLGFEGDPGRIAFQLNATHALNSALFGILRPGDRVVRTGLDHNAVRRPVAALVEAGAHEEVVALDRSGTPDFEQLRTALRGARLLVLPHASNVTGAVLPVRRMAEIAHAEGALVLLDAAQTLGHRPVDVGELGADLLAFTGHKGVPGPQGIGGLWVRPGIELAPVLHGGTGGDSGPRSMPDAWPDRLEAGTQNAPGIAGLAAAAAWVLARGVDRAASEERQLAERLRSGLAALPGVTIHSASGPEVVGIVTFTLAGTEPSALARALEARYGIQGRAGLHCAPEAHRTLGTLAHGALRLSVGWASTGDEIDRTIRAVADLSSERKAS